MTNGAGDLDEARERNRQIQAAWRYPRIVPRKPRSLSVNSSSRSWHARARPRQSPTSSWVGRGGGGRGGGVGRVLHGAGALRPVSTAAASWCRSSPAPISARRRAASEASRSPSWSDDKAKRSSWPTRVAILGSRYVTTTVVWFGAPMVVDTSARVISIY